MNGSVVAQPERDCSRQALREMKSAHAPFGHPDPSACERLLMEQLPQVKYIAKRIS